MIKILLVDDEIAAVDLLKAHLEPFSEEITLCSACFNIADAVKDIKLFKPDILLLDVELGDGLGFEILERLPDLQARVIFITAYDHYALKAIKFHAFDYLLKPVVKDEFEQVLRQAIGQVKSMNKAPDGGALLDYLKNRVVHKVAVPSRTGLHYYNLDEIFYIKADGSYAIIHLDNGKEITVSKKVKDFEDTLADKGFLRVHKSYLVNLRHISELHRDDNGYLLMSNKQKIPLASKDKELIISRIKQASYTV